VWAGFPDTGPHTSGRRLRRPRIRHEEANNKNKIGVIDMLGLDNPIHILFLLMLLLLVFGAKRLPEIGRSLGTGMRGFKDSLTGEPGHHGAAQPELTEAAQNGAVAAERVASAARAPESRA
jgi:sec-independent protein translocase protein TatA